MRCFLLATVAGILCAEASANARLPDGLPDLALPEAEPRLWAPLRRPEPLRPPFRFPIDKHTGRLVTGVHEGQRIADTEITRSYDKAGRLASHREVAASWLQLDVTFSYDAQGRIKQRVEDHGTAKNTRDYGYDAHGRLVTVRYADSNGAQRNTSLTYDATGNLATQVTAGMTLRYLRSKTGAVIDIVGERGKKSWFLYDGEEDKQGRLVSFKADASVGGEVVTAGYDAAGRLAKFISELNKRTETLAVSYDAAGRILQITEDVSFLTETRHQATSAKYDASGRMIELAMANTRQFGFPPVKGKPPVPVRTATENRRSTFSYDGKGRMKSEKVTAGGGDGHFGFKLETKYTYDARGRLILASTQEERYPPLNRTTMVTFTY